MHFKQIIFIVLAAVCCVMVCAQTKEGAAFSGKVYDAVKHMPLAAATIKQKHGKQQMLTAGDGSFTIIPAINDTLIIEHIGYETGELPVNKLGGANNIIYLKPAEQQLQDVVVNTGYQQISGERSTGSYNVIGNALLNRSVSTGIIARIENLTPGLLINHGDAAGYEIIRLTYWQS